MMHFIGIPKVKAKDTDGPRKAHQIHRDMRGGESGNPAGHTNDNDTKPHNGQRFPQEL